jgi:transposase InsO family protein
MKRSAHPERQWAFERRVVDDLHLRHGTIQPGCPWQNGLLERSNRTDHDEFFHDRRFADSEERRYQHRLWEMYYNTRRPHQALGLATPMDVYLAHYRTHAKSRMLM